MFQLRASQRRGARSTMCWLLRQEPPDPRMGCSLTNVMAGLDDRECLIIVRDFDTDRKKQTLQSICETAWHLKGARSPAREGPTTTISTVASDYQLESLLSSELHQ